MQAALKEQEKTELSLVSADKYKAHAANPGPTTWARNSFSSRSILQDGMG